MAFVAIASAVVTAGPTVIVIVIDLVISYAKWIGFGRSTGQPNTFQNEKSPRVKGGYDAGGMLAWPGLCFASCMLVQAGMLTDRGFVWNSTLNTGR